MKKRKILSLLLALVMVFSLMPISAFAAQRPAQDGEAQKIADGLLDSNGPKSLASVSGSARPGDYKMTFQALGKDLANYSNLTVKVFDDNGELLGSYDPSLYGEGDEGLDKWGIKVVPASFDAPPAEIEITCSYKYNTWETYEKISYTAPVSECCINQMAAGVSKSNQPGMQVAFCTYSIECLENGAPAAYVDAEGNHFIQEDVIRIDEAESLVTG